MGREKQKKPNKVHWNVNPANGLPKGLYCNGCKTVDPQFGVTDPVALTKLPRLSSISIACGSCGMILAVELVPTEFVKQPETKIIEPIN